MGVSEADLWSLAQGLEESLRSYITKFKEVKARIANLDDGMALAALHNGLWYTSLVRQELIVQKAEP